MKPYLSIVVPAYNEEENIKKGTAGKVSSYLKKQKYSWEIIFVDDGSSDRTVSLLRKFVDKDKGLRLIKNPHQGKAASVTTGMLAAKGEVVLFTDMDQSTPIEEVEKFLPFFKNGYDVVIASRRGRQGAPIIRKLMAWGFVVLRTVVLKLPIKDTQVGFKAFSRKAVRDIFSKLQIFKKSGVIKQSAVKAGFDIEVLYIARKHGFKIKEVPVSWQYHGTRRVNPLRDSIDAIKDIIKVRIYSLLGKYNG